MEPGREELSELQEAAPLTEVETTSPAQNQESPVRESARETAQRAFEELSKAESDGSEDAQGQEQPKITPNLVKPSDSKAEQPDLEQKSPEKPQNLPDFDMIPPERFTPQAKALFNKLPKGLKKELHRNVKDIESWAGRAIHEAKTEAQRAQTETRELTEIVRPYVAELYDRGMSVPAAVAKLLSTHQALTDADTDKRTAKWLQIGLDAQVKPEALQAIQQILANQNGAQGAGQPSIENHPQFIALQQQLNNVTSQQEQWALQSKAQPIAAEMQAIIDKTGPDGQLAYPELHAEGGLDVVKPLLEALVRNFPVSYAQALEASVHGVRADSSSLQNAYLASCRALFGNSNQLNPSRSPTSKNNIQERAVSAGFSVRGNAGTNSVRQDPNDLGPMPDWAKKDARATARWIVEQTSRGV